MLKKILLLQTAFPGDVILATAVLESLHQSDPGLEIDLLIRQGNEDLFSGHPFVHEIIIWNKQKNKFRDLLKLLFRIRKEKYDLVINLQRFGSSGFLTAFSSAKETRGFKKNPFSIFFSKRFNHIIGDGQHEIARNHSVISDLCNKDPMLPRLYPQDIDFQFVELLKKKPYICIAPSSVWFTKKFPEEKWTTFIQEHARLHKEEMIYLIGSLSERELCERILRAANISMIKNLAGEHTFLQSAALMKDAKMNYVNDSAPLHLASAMQAKTTAIFCSTIPAFGFGPLSPESHIIETKEKLKCRPCGLHGFKQCPEGHFQCAFTIEISQLIQPHGSISA